MNSATRLLPTALPQLPQGKPKCHRSIPLGSTFVKPQSPGSLRTDRTVQSIGLTTQAWLHARRIKRWVPNANAATPFEHVSCVPAVRYCHLVIQNPVEPCQARRMRLQLRPEFASPSGRRGRTPWPGAGDSPARSMAGYAPTAIRGPGVNLPFIRRPARWMILPGSW